MAHTTHASSELIAHHARRSAKVVLVGLPLAILLLAGFAYAIDHGAGGFIAAGEPEKLLVDGMWPTVYFWGVAAIGYVATGVYGWSTLTWASLSPRILGRRVEVVIMAGTLAYSLAFGACLILSGAPEPLTTYQHVAVWGLCLPAALWFMYVVGATLKSIAHLDS